MNIEFFHPSDQFTMNVPHRFLPLRGLIILIIALLACVFIVSKLRGDSPSQKPILDPIENSISEFAEN